MTIPVLKTCYAVNGNHKGHVSLLCLTCVGVPVFLLLLFFKAVPTTEKKPDAQLKAFCMRKASHCVCLEGIPPVGQQGLLSIPGISLEFTPPVRSGFLSNHLVFSLNESLGLWMVNMCSHAGLVFMT